MDTRVAPSAGAINAAVPTPQSARADGSRAFSSISSDVGRDTRRRDGSLLLCVEFKNSESRY